MAKSKYIYIFIKIIHDVIYNNNHNRNKILNIFLIFIFLIQEINHI